MGNWPTKGLLLKRSACRASTKHVERCLSVAGCTNLRVELIHINDLVLALTVGDASPSVLGGLLQ